MTQAIEQSPRIVSRRAFLRQAALGAAATPRIAAAGETAVKKTATTAAQAAMGMLFNRMDNNASLPLPSPFNAQTDMPEEPTLQSITETTPPQDILAAAPAEAPTIVLIGEEPQSYKGKMDGPNKQALQTFSAIDLSGGKTEITATLEAHVEPGRFGGLVLLPSGDPSTQVRFQRGPQGLWTGALWSNGRIVNKPLGMNTADKLSATISIEAESITVTPMEGGTAVKFTAEDGAVGRLMQSGHIDVAAGVGGTDASEVKISNLTVTPTEGPRIAEQAAGGQVLLIDNFDSADTSNFGEFEGPNGSVKIVNGQLVIVREVGNAPIIQTHGHEEYSDFQFETSVNLMEIGIDHAIYLQGRNSPRGGYRLTLYPKGGAFKLERYNFGINLDGTNSIVPTELIPLTYTQVINKGTAVNRAGLRFKGSRITVLLNGEDKKWSINDKNDETLTSGDILFGATGPKTDRIEARIDNLKVTSV